MQHAVFSFSGKIINLSISLQNRNELDYLLQLASVRRVVLTYKVEASVYRCGEGP